MLRLKFKQLSDHSLVFQQFESYFIKKNLNLLIVESAYPKDNLILFEELIIHESDSANSCFNNTDTSYPFDHYVLNALSGSMKNKRITRNNKAPYLLSGCIAILSYEPCIMCSMALLHSRIDAVVFYNYSKDSGALGSKCFLHSMESLNHHFPVYLLDNNVDFNQ